MKGNRKGLNPKKLDADGRIRDARKWLLRCATKDLRLTYAKRYGVSDAVAYHELLELGYSDELSIQFYESQGIEWEYRFDGYAGDMRVVPKGTPDWELHLY